MNKPDDVQQAKLTAATTLLAEMDTLPATVSIQLPGNVRRACESLRTALQKVPVCTVANAEE